MKKITVKNHTIEYTNEQGVELRGCENVTVKRLHSVGSEKTRQTRDSSGLSIIGCKNVTVMNAVVKSFDFNVFVKGSQDIYINNLDSSDFGQQGLQIKQSNGVIVNNANIHDNGEPFDQGLAHEDGIFIAYSNSNITVANTRIYNISTPKVPQGLLVKDGLCSHLTLINCQIANVTELDNVDGFKCINTTFSGTLRVGKRLEDAVLINNLIKNNVYQRDDAEIRDLFALNNAANCNNGSASWTKGGWLRDTPGFYGYTGEAPTGYGHSQEMVKEVEVVKEIGCTPDNCKLKPYCADIYHHNAKSAELSKIVKQKVNNEIEW